MQEALSRVVGRWSRIAAAGDPEPYVRRVIYTVVVDRSRRRSSAERPPYALAQMAEVMGCSPGTVKSQIAHALVRLLSPELAVSFGRETNDPSEVSP